MARWLLVLSTLLASGSDFRSDPTRQPTRLSTPSRTSRRDRHRPKPRSDALRRYRDASRTRRRLRANRVLRADRPSRALRRPRRPGGISRRSTAGTRRSRSSSSTRSQPIRVSDYDQRPYKTLSTARGSTTPDRHAVYVISHVDIAPSRRRQPPDALRSHAEASRKEPGNLRFDVVQHTMRGNHFTVVEGWRNQQALDAHVGCGSHATVSRHAPARTGSPLDERVYKAIE